MHRESPSTRVVPPASALLRYEGADVLAVLHRIGTQALADLTAGAVRMTLFCDFRGRLLHRAAVAVTSDGAVWLARDDGPAEELGAHVDAHVFREDVKRTEVPAGLGVVPSSASSRTSPGTIEEREGVPVRLQIAPDFALRLETVAPGRTPSAERFARFEFERIRAGRPRHAQEIREDFNPYEVGLANEVHLDKGCYTGQEALQRLITYQSVRRRLVRLIGSGDTPEVLLPIRRDPSTVGVLTSVVRDGDDWIGLGVLRHEALEDAERLELEGDTTIDLVEPFSELRPLGLPG